MKPGESETYETWASFFRDPDRGAERHRSREIDFGWWHADMGTAWPRSVRVSWIEETGELYLFRSRGLPAFEVVLIVTDQALLSDVMRGWDAASCRPSGLTWLRQRVRAIADVLAAGESVKVLRDAARESGVDLP